VGERVAVDQHLGVPVRKPVATLLGPCVRVVDLEDPGDRLLLEPLARVALVGSGRGGELGRGGLASLGQRPVVAEAIAQVDGHQLVGAQGGAKEALGQGIAPRVLYLSGQSTVYRWSSGGFWTLCSVA
jgi:hypothetical protein